MSFDLLYEANGDATNFVRTHFPDGLFLYQMCPYFVVWLTSPIPRGWLRENLKGFWMRFSDGIYFSDPDDAFAFKMRWG